MASHREMRLHIRSVKNIAQVTRASEAVSASKVKRAVAAVQETKAYADKAWMLLTHLAEQPGHTSMHPLLADREEKNRVLVVAISSDRGLAGSFNANLVRFTLEHFAHYPVRVSYVTVGRKGRDMIYRRRGEIIGEFSNIPSPPTVQDVSPISKLIVDDFLANIVDSVYLIYTDFINMMVQKPVLKKLLPLRVEAKDRVMDFDTSHHTTSNVFTYEPGQSEILDEIVPRFTALQVYQAILESQASEHAARMVAMRQATDNATELIKYLELQYNKSRQKSITDDILDISGGAEALAQAMAQIRGGNDYE
jgi:F-type H+-transporting ATPase subunit gamma